VDESLAPPSAFLGILGVTGLTAWAGLNRIAGIQAGETVFISAGAGAVGSAACQLAKLHDCRVIASAGSDEKVVWLSNELHVDYAFNYRAAEPLASLKQGAPDGIDVYFDNTGGPQLEAALYALRERGKVALCGAVAGYDTLIPGPRNLPIAIGKRLTLQGFIVSDFFSERAEFLAEVVPALHSGRLVNRETIVDGLDAAPRAMIDLLHSGATNIGKMIVRLSN
jgi:NADPH-dependent curcumin reductase CurA